MILSLLFSLFTSTFSLFAQASITYSVIHGFYGRPWLLAPVIVVAESSWGLESLRRSDYLMKRMKGVALSMLLFFGFFSGLLVITISFPGEGLHIGNIDSPWKIWPLVVRIVVTSALPMVLQLYSIAAFAVLYMDCKAMHGELVLEIVEEFAGAYFYVDTAILVCTII
ncbi:hypothetical protein OIU85_006260 [Salix viminalis]|uniref:Amino acid transporter transmembrane domain-containing protein n=1 Tax=Salix viminalis TaxID=40686 RepID=A0A9Q0PLB7_SALVM|nr:hypothetical protein OIU85_006260 [Salix viminalis]